MEAKINSIDYIILNYILSELNYNRSACSWVPQGYVYMSIVSSRTINKQVSGPIRQATPSKCGLLGIPSFPGKDGAGHHALSIYFRPSIFHVSSHSTLIIIL